MVPLLAVRASLDVLVAPTGSALFAAGAPRYASWANIIRLATLVCGLYLTLSPWGLQGAMWVLIGAPAISYIAFIPGVRRQLPGGFRVEIASLGVFWTGTALALTIHLSM
jgi:O-antigen/teichoic acid export membrane protein